MSLPIEGTMEEERLLEGLGLTNGEVRVYFALLEIGSSTTGEIIKKAKVSRSKVYEMLGRLTDRGLVSFVIRENTKYFEAADPEHLVHYVRRERSLLEEKEKELKKILPSLRQKKKFVNIPQTSTVYEGIQGIKTMYSEVLYSLKKGDQYYAISAEPEVINNKLFMVFIKNFHKRREERGIKVKLLAPKKIKPAISKIFRGTQLMKIKYFDQNIPCALLIYGESIATYVWGEQPSGVVIKSEIIARRYKHFFEEVWIASK